MPHAVIIGASDLPEFPHGPLSRDATTIHKVTELLEGPQGWVLKSLVLERGEQTKFLTRIDRREDGMLVRLDDHMHVERTPNVFDHLAYITQLVLDANPEAEIGQTNLQDQLARVAAHA